MKNNKLVKILTLVLSLVILVCSLAVISVGATSEEPKIIAQNIVYGEKISIAYAVNVDVADAIAGNVKLSYYWSDETAEDAKYATLLDTTVESNLYKGYPVFVTEGLPAKDLDKVAFASVQVGEEAPASYDYSYSTVHYLYKKLYVEGFATKTEADGLDYERRNLYFNLLNYGSSAQAVLINGKVENEADKVTLINEYSFAYSNDEGVVINGASYVLSENAVTVTLTYNNTTELDLVGWTLTASDGTVTNKGVADEIVIDGTVCIAPNLEAHECADAEGDGDHNCDKCGEPMGECADTNADHYCDECGARLECVDANTDSICDICKAICFENSLTTGVHLATGSAVLQTEITKGETYTPATVSGFWGNIVNVTKSFEGGRTEVSNVLQIICNNNSAKNTSLGTLGGAVYFTPQIASDDGGNIHVVEFDFNWASSAKSGWRNPFTLMAWDANGTALGEVCNGNGKDNEYCVNALNRGGAFAEGTVVENAYQLGISGSQTEAAGGSFSLLNSGTWYRLRYVWDQSTGKVNIAASNDGGETWYKVCSEQGKAAYADCAYLTISFTKPYANGGIMYFDNVNYNIVTDMPSMPSNNIPVELN